MEIEQEEGRREKTEMAAEERGRRRRGCGSRGARVRKEEARRRYDR
jgi:hypothetical protein